MEHKKTTSNSGALVLITHLFVTLGVVLFGAFVIFDYEANPVPFYVLGGLFYSFFALFLVMIIKEIVYVKSRGPCSGV